jgi:hypothetical protein
VVGQSPRHPEVKGSIPPTTAFSEREKKRRKKAPSLKFQTNLSVKIILTVNGTARFEKSKQLLEYQNLLLLSDIWWLKHQCFKTPMAA